MQRVQWMQRFIEVCNESVKCLDQQVIPSFFAYLDQRANVLVLNGTLALQLVETSSVCTVSHALILQITLATLVANGAVKRVVCQQELHHALARLVNLWAVRLNHHAGLDRPRARSHRLGCALDFNQTHSAVSSNHKLLVVTVAGDGRAGLFTGLDERGAGCTIGLALDLPRRSAASVVHTLDGHLLAINGELDLGGESRTGGEVADDIRLGSRALGALERAQQLLPHHLVLPRSGGIGSLGGVERVVGEVGVLVAAVVVVSSSMFSRQAPSVLGNSCGKGKPMYALSLVSVPLGAS
jgi:hypothetical protein